MFIDAEAVLTEIAACVHAYKLNHHSHGKAANQLEVLVHPKTFYQLVTSNHSKGAVSSGDSPTVYGMTLHVSTHVPPGKVSFVLSSEHDVFGYKPGYKFKSSTYPFDQVVPVTSNHSSGYTVTSAPDGNGSTEYNVFKGPALKFTLSGDLVAKVHAGMEPMPKWVPLQAWNQVLALHEQNTQHKLTQLTQLKSIKVEHNLPKGGYNVLFDGKGYFLSSEYLQFGSAHPELPQWVWDHVKVLAADLILTKPVSKNPVPECTCLFDPVSCKVHNLKASVMGKLYGGIAPEDVKEVASMAANFFEGHAEVTATAHTWLPEDNWIPDEESPTGKWFQLGEVDKTALVDMVKEATEQSHATALLLARDLYQQYRACKGKPPKNVDDCSLADLLERIGLPLIVEPPAGAKDFSEPQPIGIGVDAKIKIMDKVSPKYWTVGGATDPYSDLYSNDGLPKSSGLIQQSPFPCQCTKSKIVKGAINVTGCPIHDPVLSFAQLHDDALKAKLLAVDKAMLNGVSTPSIPLHAPGDIVAVKGFKMSGEVVIPIEEVKSNNVSNFGWTDDEVELGEEDLVEQPEDDEDGPAW